MDKVIVFPFTFFPTKLYANLIIIISYNTPFSYTDNNFLNLWNIVQYKFNVTNYDLAFAGTQSIRSNSTISSICKKVLRNNYFFH